MRRLRIGIAVATACLPALVATPASAYNSWCSDEPPVTVVLPSGSQVTLNNFLYFQREDAHLAHASVVYATAVGDGAGGATVTVHLVTPPGGHANVQWNSRSQRYNVLAETTAAWGTVSTLTVDIPDAASAQANTR